MDAAAGRLGRAFGPVRIDGAARTAAVLTHRLRQAGLRLVEVKGHGLALAATTLGGLDPEIPLRRGYALVRVQRTNLFLRRPDEVRAGDALDIRVSGGRVAAVVAPRPAKEDP